MCGRYMITSPEQAMLALFEAKRAGDPAPDLPRLNVSPTQTVPVVVAREGRRTLVPMRWGFLPHWYKAPTDGPLLINARAETIATKPAFRAAVRERRCLVPADGFYEWKGASGAKVPFVIRPRRPGPIAFAGIWQNWGPDVAPTCAIVTCAASAALAAIHERMPVVLAPEDWPLWLGEAGKGAAVLMRPAPDDALAAEPADGDTRALLARRPDAPAQDRHRPG
jgi:putative SOS response-associated peptidase YedK